MNNMSTLLDGLGMSNNVVAAPVQNDSSLNDLFGGGLNNGSDSGIPSLVGYNKNDISITFHFDRPQPSLVVMNLRIVNSSLVDRVSDFTLQAAVPKSMQVEIMAASSTDMSPNGGVITQILKVNNPNRAVVKMRLKVSYSRGGQQVLDQAEVSNFPPALTM